jgi:putative membrane protein
VLGGIFIGGIGISVCIPLAVTGVLSSVAWGALAIPPAVALFVWLGLRGLRHQGWAVTPREVLFKSGAFTRRVSAAPYDKLQTVHVSATPFDRWNDHATLSVDTAGAGPFSHHIRIPYIDAQIASATAQELSAAAARSTFGWS